jgi:hypothetical protein
MQANTSSINQKNFYNIKNIQNDRIMTLKNGKLSGKHFPDSKNQESLEGGGGEALTDCQELQSCLASM